MFRMMATALIEPIFYHPMTVKWSLEGNIDLLTGKKNWGEMTRQGLGKKKAKKEKTQAKPEEPDKETPAPPSS